MMKRIYGIPFLALLFCLQSATVSSMPAPRGAVNDYASVLSADVEQQMQGLSVEVLKKTGTSMVVATVNDLENQSPEEYAARLYKTWGIGQKGEDKGVLFLLALTHEGRHIRIETGYGVEGILPDGRVGRIIDSYMLPYLKQGDYNKGLWQGLAAVGQVIAKDSGVNLTGQLPVARPVHRASRRRQSGGIGTIVLFIILMIVTRGRILPWLIMGSMMGGGRSRGGFGGGFDSGGFGGGFGGGMSGGGGAGRSF